MAQQDQQQGGGASLSSMVSTGKDAVALLRDAALLFLAVLLLGWPETFNATLVKAGFDSGSIVGLQWKAKVSQQDKELVAAQAVIEDLKAQNANLEQALKEAKSQVADVELKKRIVELASVNELVLPAASQVQSSLRQSIAANTEFVQQYQVASPTSAESWAVVFGGDATLPEARHETETVARKLGINNAGIYYRQGSYRSVVVAVDRGQANQLLNVLKRVKGDAYLVNMSTWCPRAEARNGFQECAAPG